MIRSPGTDSAPSRSPRLPAPPFTPAARCPVAFSPAPLLARAVVYAASICVVACADDSDATSGPGITSLLPPDEAWVEQVLSRLTLREKVGQMIVPWMAGDYLPAGGAEYDRLLSMVEEQGVGGIVVSLGPPLEVAAKLNLLQDRAPIPLLIASDLEHGPGQRLTGGTVLPYGIEIGGGTAFPPPMAIGAAGDERLAFEMGRVTAREARAVGIHLAYAPVADVNSNPANPIINVRSYGEDPGLVARLAVAQLRGMQENGLLATAKHFPGHGDTEANSHLGLPVLSASPERAASVELVPFRAAIAAGVAGVMTAHIAFPALSGDSLPASLSPALLSGLLRSELGFAGLIVTDALDMRGVPGEEAAVRALLAGADILLMPPNIDAAIEAIVGEVDAGRIPEARIDSSVTRLLSLKTRVGLHRRRRVVLDSVAAIVGTPAHRAVAAEVADRSLTLLRDRQRLLPINPGDPDRRVVSMVYTDDYDPWAGRAFQRALSERIAAEPVLLDRRTPDATLDSLLAATAGADLVIVAALVQVRSWKAEIGMDPRVAALVEAIGARQPTLVVSFGSPYLIGQFRSVGSYLLAWGEEDVAQESAVRGILGEVPIVGTTPISIPPGYPIGAGERRSAGIARR